MLNQATKLNLKVKQLSISQLIQQSKEDNHEPTND